MPLLSQGKLHLATIKIDAGRFKAAVYTPLSNYHLTYTKATVSHYGIYLYTLEIA
jgi:hypothetical protein